MADESITSSPRKLNRSIHRSRLDRKNKRFNQTCTKAEDSVFGNDNTSTKNCDEGDLSGTLLIMYDSDDAMGQHNEKVVNVGSRQVKPPFEIAPNFNPYAEQRPLVLADRLSAPPRSSFNFVATQGFKPSNSFLFQSPELHVQKTDCSKCEQLDSFEITDSELLQVCEENEKIETLNNSQNSEDPTSPKTPETGQKPKSIVDLILEDFCSSPASPDLQQSSQESTFHFKFTNKPLRTYSRSKQENALARKNIAEQYLSPANNAARCPIEDDLLSNDSSTDLSVQEDLTQIHYATDIEQVIDLQNSQNLCANLQNLSAYFKELSGEIKQNEDISKIETKIHIDQNDSKTSVLTLTMPNTDIQKERTKGDELDFNNDDYVSIEEDLKGFESEEDGACVDKKLAECQNCAVITTRVDDLGSVDDDDEWNDECDFLANFDMDVVLDTAYKVEQTESLEYNNKLDGQPLQTAEMIPGLMEGFPTDFNKGVSKRAEAQAFSSKILEELPPHSAISNYDKEQIKEGEKTLNLEKVLNQTETISRPEHKGYLENDTKRSPKIQEMVNNFERKLCRSETTAIVADSLEHALTEKEIASTSVAVPNLQQKQPFVGFRTASSKEIITSKQAQERAAKILQQLPQLNIVEEKDSANMLLSSSTYSGFRTASSKAISISKEAQTRAALIMQELANFSVENVDNSPGECLQGMQLSEWLVEEEIQRETKITSERRREFGQNMDTKMLGFSTASNKAIEISESSKKRAAAILDNLPELPVELPIESEDKRARNDSSISETIDNVVFSEWPLLDASEDLQSDQQQLSIDSTKRKRQSADCTENCEEPKSPQRTAKVVCEEPKSPQRTAKVVCESPGIQRSPLAHIQSAVSHSSLRELAVKTPPDYRAVRGIISRKNLLSLSKRNKFNAKSLQHIGEEINNSPQTPTKRIEIKTNTNEAQSPPDTPTLNLKEFFSSATMSTSTPQPPHRESPPRTRTRARRRAELEAAAMSTPTNDTSLRRIVWDNESINKSASLNTSKLSNSSLSNITKMASNPTPKQRIERLRMYGKPPNVSPICMSGTNNCRTSGLKRLSRSATKKEKES